MRLIQKSTPFFPSFLLHHCLNTFPHFPPSLSYSDIPLSPSPLTFILERSPMTSCPMRSSPTTGPTPTTAPPSRYSPRAQTGSRYGALQMRPVLRSSPSSHSSLPSLSLLLLSPYFSFFSFVYTVLFLIPESDPGFCHGRFPRVPLLSHGATAGTYVTIMALHCHYCHHHFFHCYTYCEGFPSLFLHFKHTFLPFRLSFTSCSPVHLIHS